MAIQLFIWALITGIAASVNLCAASSTTDKLEMLGSSLDDLETAPLGAQVRVEGKLLGNNSRREPANGDFCVAFYLEVTLVSETTDADGDRDHHHYQVYKEVSGPSSLTVERGRIKVALPLRYWTRYHKSSERETKAWPAWLDPKHRVNSYAGKFEHYDVETLCLKAGATMFLAGSIADVSEAGEAEATSDNLLEIRNPLVRLRPSPGFGPVEVWPGTELERIGNLVGYRRRKRIYGGLLSALAAILFGIGVFTLRREI